MSSQRQQHPQQVQNQHQHQQQHQQQQHSQVTGSDTRTNIPIVFSAKHSQEHQQHGEEGKQRRSGASNQQQEQHQVHSQNEQQQQHHAMTEHTPSSGAGGLLSHNWFSHLDEQDPLSTWMNPFQNAKQLWNQFANAAGLATADMPAFPPIAHDLKGVGMSLDIIEHPNEYLLRAECPGVKKEDLKVRLEGDILTIEGERRMERSMTHRDNQPKDSGEKSSRMGVDHQSDDGVQWIRRECSYGSMSRSIRLPEDAVAALRATGGEADPSRHIQAEYENGVLNITLKRDPNAVAHNQIEHAGDVKKVNQQQQKQQEQHQSHHEDAKEKGGKKTSKNAPIK